MILLAILAAVVAHHTVTLTWAPSTGANVTNYRLYKQGPKLEDWHWVKLLPATVCTPTCQYVDPVLGGQTLGYFVTAVDSSNQESIPSNAVVVTIPTP
jgi:hypothetical protein